MPRHAGDTPARATAGRGAALRGVALGALALSTVAPAEPLATTESRPSGALSGKIVYLNAGHGWTASNLSGGAWSTQRGETFEIVEDLLNGDFHAFQAQSLWNAGATIVPLRPIGAQPNEVVLDNDDPGVRFEGAWSDSVSSVFFGSPGDVPYRFAFTAPSETARAVYRPLLPEPGVYPVYTWVLGDANRVDQLYRVEHSGGTTEVRVDHRRVGGGLVYLGSYHFNAGSDGAVIISNRSETPGVVIADAIRFGNGMGDIDRGAGPSGFPRADEASLYWIEAHAGQGVPPSAWRSSADDGASTVGTPPRWAARMNLAQAGTPADRVFLSHHSNAGGGAARGVIALYNGNNNPASATPNQFLLADTLARTINTDLPAQDGPYEHPWATRSVLTLDRTDFEFGEISNLAIGGEFDATIVERAFHDNRQDAELLRDTRVNRALAEATTRGLIRFFRDLDGGETPLVVPPAPVTDASAVPDGAGAVRLDWCVPAPTPWRPDAPTAVVVQHSADGRGFVDALAVPPTGPLVISGLGEGLRFFRLVAQNEGGRSEPTAVLAATPARAPDVLIVDGFDREDRFLNRRESVGFGIIDRVQADRQNPRRSAVPVAFSIAGAGLGIGSASNEAVAGGAVELAPFPGVFWLLGEESSGTRTFDAAEQFVASRYALAGGSLLASGSEIAWDLDFLGNGRGFLRDTLGVSYLADDAQTYLLAGEAGTPFAGLGARFDDGTEWYDAQFPDVFEPVPGASTVLRYAGGAPAGVEYSPPGGGRTLTLGFPIETVVPDADRDELVRASLRTLALLTPPCPADLDGNGVLDLNDINTFVAGFLAQDTVSDLDGNALWDLADINIFVTSFTGGCP